MPWVDTDSLDRSALSSNMMALQVYNGLDCGVTFEVWLAQQQDLLNVPHAENVRLIYGFELAMQAPCFAMQRRGLRVDRAWRGIAKAELQKELRIANARFNRLAEAVWGIPADAKGRPINPQLDAYGRPDKTLPGLALNFNSPTQLKSFFYETLGIEPIYEFKKGEKKISTGREALEKLQEFRHSAIFAKYIIYMRDLGKKISVLSKPLSPLGRMHCSYHVAGTETGRLSSTADPFGDGDNLQNWTKRMRRAIVADAGKKFISIDLSQAESFAVGGAGYRDSGRRHRGYLDACRSGDPHTIVTKMVWQDLQWTGDLKSDKKIAEQPFYHHHTHRDLSKRGGHGSNYYGKPFTIAKNMKVPQSFVESFQLKYFRQFPEIRSYQQRQIIRIQTEQKITTPLGRTRFFFGRTDDEATHRKAIAFEPQSLIADALNLGMWRIWKELEIEQGKIELLLQVHDNVVFQVDDDPEDPENDAKQTAIIKRALELLQVEIPYEDEIILIPADVETGWNWGPAKSDAGNVDGLVAWSGSDARRRKSDPDASGLDRELL